MVDNINVLPPVRIGVASNPKSVAVGLGAVNIFQNWSLTYPVMGRTNYIPAIVVDSIEQIPSDTPVGTAILVKET
jgi:ABC-type molybdate transport system substrate-binding protein